MEADEVKNQETSWPKWSESNVRADHRHLACCSASRGDHWRAYVKAYRPHPVILQFWNRLSWGSRSKNATLAQRAEKGSMAWTLFTQNGCL